MSEIFVIRNQLGHYWGKSKVWTDGRDSKAVLRLKHHDEGLNTLVEISSKDITLRGEVLCLDIDAGANPVFEISDIPLPDEVNPEVTDNKKEEQDADNVVAPDSGTSIPTGI
ncbi:MAG: hypothetical protein ACK5ME_09590 [Parahaliea sp.]